MDREETLKIMAVLKAAYPAYYRDMPKRDAENAVSLWNEMFAEDDYAVVGAAVKALIASDVKGFPPNIGAVKAQIQRILPRRTALGGDITDSRQAESDERQRRWYEAHVARRHALGLPTGVEAKKQGIPYCEYTRMVEGVD